MKKLIIAIGTLSVCLIFCTASVKAQVHYATLTGKTSPELSYLIIALSENYDLSNSDTIKISKNKTFTHRIKITYPSSVYLTYGDKQTTLWLKPGDVLSVDLQNITPEFKGTPTVFSKYFISDNDYLKNIFNDYKKRNPNFTKGETDKYLTILDSMTNDRLDFLKKYFAGVINKDKPEFVKQQSASLRYMNLFQKLATSNPDLEKLKFYQDKYKINRADYYAMSDKVEFNNPKLLSIYYYRSFFCLLVDDMARKRIKDKGEKFVYANSIDLFMSIIDELTAGANTNVELKAIFFNDVEMKMRAERNLNITNKAYAVLSALSVKYPNGSLKIVKEKLYKIIADTKYKTGAKAPDFILKDIAGKTYTPNDFKGKKVYIDMGASWCVHCIESIPAWNKLVAANKNNENVIFISLSLDDKETEWKTFLKKHTINGMNLYAGEGGLNSNFGTSYAIFSLPHFMLIDEDGKILRYNAPEPDSDGIAPLLQVK